MVEVAIVAFEGISMFHLSVPIAIFRDALLNEQKLFNVRVCSEMGGQVNSADGLGIDIQNDISMINQADIVIVPSWIPDKIPSTSLKRQLVAAHQSNKLIVGLCIGAYAIAHCGVLNGMRATTHWKYGADFAKKFPLITCDINPLFIVERNVITSAGSAAAIDCCLHIVKHYYGVKVANKIARVMVSSPERNGGQNQYIETPTIEKPSDERIAKLVDLILENITDTYTLESVAEYCMMSVRSFSRNFKSSNAISFNAWLINVRLNYSLELLESTSLTVSEISERAGFHSEQIYRKHFIKKYDIPPKAWQKTFKSPNHN
ncbi:GlxA family transcriptional regulator [Marinomonas algicola]|uniref:GlxA family transcriptional regulator n=1 Tax=Marinomonas algicola TaxID=2773454 RepID=UPI00174C0668|nr:helix-turn-helix domain-containing protein [Marinomonas algicola]